MMLTYEYDTHAPQFTGKERDETNLDYFGARYFSGAMGRWTSPDPLLNSGRPDIPQSWNRYNYVSNNPLKFVDPTGLYQWAADCKKGDTKCEDERQRFRDSITKAEESLEGLDKNSDEHKELEKVLKKLGKENDGKIEIAFGQAKDGAPASTLGREITIDYSVVDAISKGYSLTQDDTAILDAGITVHEGEHSSPAFSFLGPLRTTLNRESSAYRKQSILYQGLKYNDPVFKIWNESFYNVDKEIARSTAIKTHLDSLK